MILNRDLEAITCIISNEIFSSRLYFLPNVIEICNMLWMQ